MNCFIKRGVVVGCLLLVGLVGAKEWDILTDQRSIRDVVYQDGRFWCATEGGLSVFDPNDGQFDLLTMIDGLAGVGIGLITQDASGGLWLGFDNRMIQRWLPGSGATHTVSSLAGEAGLSAINSIQLDQRGIYVGTNRGISRLLFVAEHDRWVWFEEYRRLGSGIEDQPVRDILLLDSALWAATPLGVAIGNLTAGSPLSSSDWRVHNTNHGLPSVDVRSLARYRGEILAATGGGLAAWNGSSWRRIDIRTDIVRVEVQGDTLWAVGRNGLWYWNGSVLERIGAARPNLSAGLKDSSGEVWISSLRTSGNVGGLSRLVDGAWVDHLPNGPSTNMVWAFAFTPDGDLLLTGGRQGGEYGLSRRTGLTWRNWVGPQLTERIFSAPTRDIALDYDGGIWVGSFFGGIARFAPDGTYATFDHSAETGARLVGYGFSGAEATLVLAPAVETDPLGNVWVVNRGASNGRVLVCIPRDFIQDPRPEKEWVYFHRSQFGNYPHFDLIAVDARGRKWIASTDPTVVEGRGVYALDDRGTPDNPDDDRIWGPVQGLGVPQALSMAYDPAGYLWVGSVDGAYYLNVQGDDLSNARFSSIYWLREVGITAVTVDPAGNKWFGSDFGVTILAPDLFTIVRRISDDYPDRLPNSRIVSLAIDPQTGRAYIGTNDGTAVLNTGYREFGESISELSIEPNPYNPNEGLLVFKGSSLAGEATAHIFTADGRLVRKLSHFDAALGWDGRNDLGDEVADGVYLILTSNAAGQTGRAKLFLIRR